MVDQVGGRDVDDIANIRTGDARLFPEKQGRQRCNQCSGNE
jgi:hypothetical protein